MQKNSFVTQMRNMKLETKCTASKRTAQRRKNEQLLSVRTAQWCLSHIEECELGYIIWDWEERIQKIWNDMSIGMILKMMDFEQGLEIAHNIDDTDIIQMTIQWHISPIHFFKVGILRQYSFCQKVGGTVLFASNLAAEVDTEPKQRTTKSQRHRTGVI